MAALDQSTVTLTCRVHIAWWLRVYLNTLIALCQMVDAEPNMERVSYWLRRGVTASLVK